MLTFEEFFNKKKIDLLQLQVAEPALFAEFSKHYPLMGEKSFDHAKKYWFNKLRRSYPLLETVKPHAVKAEAISEMAIQGVAAAAAQNLDQTLEKPKFKEDNLPDFIENNVSAKEVSLAEEEKIIIEQEKSEEEKSEEREPKLAKSAFKPRFNAKNIKKPEDDLGKSDEAKKSNEPATEPEKPAFKPRFNMQNIKKDVVKEASETELKAPEPVTENPKPATEPVENKEAKPVYKPRFQMKNITKPTSENSPPAQ